MGDCSVRVSEICKGAQHDDQCQNFYSMMEQGRHDLGVYFSSLIEENMGRKDLKAGRRTYAFIILCGFEMGDLLGSRLIRMFASCGSIPAADQVFNKISRPGCLSVCSIICAYTKLGQAKHAIRLFFQLCQSRMDQDGHTVAAVLKACSILAALEEGNVIYLYILEGGFDSDVFVVNSLITLYAQCGRLEDAHRLFDRFSRPELVTWSVMIGEYTKLGRGCEALHLYFQMLQQDIKPDNVIFTIVLNACASIVNIEQGKLVHGHYVQSGLKSDSYIENTMVDMYAKCGNLEDARKIFLTSQHQDVATWCGMMTGFSQHGRFHEALDLFWKMQAVGVEPNHFTFACALKACSDLGDLSHGKVIHGQVICTGHDFDKFIKSTLINMYSKCGSLEDAHRVFEKMAVRGLVDWSVMISGLAMHKHSQQSLQIKHLMQEEGLNLDKTSFTDMLKACASASTLGEAKLIHSQIIESGFECDRFIGASLIDTYAKCRTLDDARKVFNQLLDKDVVIWGVMMTGYLEVGISREVLHLFQDLLKDGLEPNHVVVVFVLKACSSLVALDEGKLIHCSAMETGCELDMFVGSSLINMYSKCGSLVDACRMFERLPKQNMVIWTAMIGGCAHHNEYRMALRYFEDMQRAGLKPDGQTFMCLLTACNHVGLAEDCHLHLISMTGEHGVAPTVDHFNCVVDILGRTGRVEAAKDLLETKTYSDNIVGWMSLLSHCRTYGKIHEGNQCLEHIMAFDRKHAAGYTLMSKVYESAGMRENAEMLLTLRDSANAWKKPGEAFILLENQVHGFFVGEKTHPQIHEIHQKLKKLHMQMQERGFIF